MSNITKKLPEHNNPASVVRVYMDLPSSTNMFLEQLAQSQGRTKKGQLEFMISEAKRHFDAMEAETNKREQEQKKRGRK